MKKILFLIALVIAIQAEMSGQYVVDALRYSQLYYQGSARSMAVGGALSALGGDFSVLSTNPGGLGVFRSNDFSASLEAYSSKAGSVYNGSSNDAGKTMFDISNLGYVMSKSLGKGGRGWRYWQFAFGMNRLNNYNGSLVISGENQKDSRMDVYINQTLDMLDAGTGLDKIYDYDPFYLGPAWDTYLLDTVTVNNSLMLVSPVPAGGILQSQTINTKGSNNEFLLSAAANYDDIIYFGATLGIPYLRYTSESIYEEYDVADTIDSFNYWSVTENLKTTGTGINLKLGAIIRPIDFLRIGLAFHTPTYYFSMKDSWSTLTNSDVVALSTGELINQSSASPLGEYKYNFTTPMRFIGSLAFVIKDIGFISGEYEYAGYNSAKFSANDYSFNTENQGIKDTYKGVSIIRAGTEWRISSISLRAGYALNGSPYKNGLNDGKRQSFSGGIGYRGSNFAIDFAYVRSVTKETSLDPPLYTSSNTFTDQNFVLSLRYFFSKR